ncbi:MAG: 7-carboxy-7-deazaguanine synthase QueE [Planctomycetaceae bacterium]|nr:7-carboxy-7-deazaguanine synthase QueE [Planctomycetaceae bacterium]
MRNLKTRSNMQKDKISISEIFYSIQGEGFLAGVPSVFIRIAGCPLRCKFCDTSYAADAKSGKKLSISQILTQIKKYPTKYIVITGGEPMVCQNLSLLCKALKKYHITIETAGIKFIGGLKCDLMSISPKLSNAYSKPGDKKTYLKIDELQKLISHYNYQLKFVVEKEKDAKEVNQILKKLKNLDSTKVMLMPQARKLADYMKRGELCAKLCKKCGFAFSPRLQITLWGNKKGK